MEFLERKNAKDGGDTEGDTAVIANGRRTPEGSSRDSPKMEIERSDVGRRTSIFKFYAYKNLDKTQNDENNANNTKNGPLVGVIEVGTRTIRFVVFRANHVTEVVSHHVLIEQINPQEGWIEQDPKAILAAITTCIEETVSKLKDKEMKVEDIVAVGIANQRETTIMWDALSGEPLYNAILWSDIRTDTIVDRIIAKFPDQNKNHLIPLCGLPVSSYFSALKICWMQENMPAVRKAISEKRCKVGTVDTWVVWNLTGGTNGGLYITDVTNASRTMLMNIETISWDSTLCRYFNIPMHILPEIKSSSEIYGKIVNSPLSGIPISAILGNQQASLIGQHCLNKGQTKNTYRRGCFLLCNTGNDRVFSTHGLATTVAYQLGPKRRPIYALEGSVAVAGAATKWLQDKMKFIKSVEECEESARSVTSTGDVYFVPAFTGLFAPYWRKDARGIICGLTAYTTKHHIVRASLEAVCFQTRDILEAMHKDCGFPITRLNVDGTMSTNNLLMQLQADLSGIPIFRATVSDMTALGAAMIAGNAEGIDVWELEGEYVETVPTDTFLPTTKTEERDARYKKWKIAVEKSLGWATIPMSPEMTDDKYFLLASIPASWYIMSSFIVLQLSNHMNR